MPGPPMSDAVHASAIGIELPERATPARRLTPGIVTTGTGWATNVAEIVLAADIVKVHGAVPEQPAPDQPVNVDPAAGVAVRVTIEPAPTSVTQVRPQSTVSGLDVTVPEPLPALVTVRS